MFKSMKFRQPVSGAATERTIIGQSAVVVGNIVSQELVQLKGHVVGNIDVNGSPNAQLSVLSQAHVEGDISAQQAVVNGWLQATSNRQGVSSCMLEPMSKAIFPMPPWRLSMGQSCTE